MYVPNKIMNQIGEFPWMNSESKLLPGSTITNPETFNCKRTPRFATTNGKVLQKKGYYVRTNPEINELNA